MAKIITTIGRKDDPVRLDPWHYIKEIHWASGNFFCVYVVRPVYVATPDLWIEFPIDSDSGSDSQYRIEADMYYGVDDEDFTGVYTIKKADVADGSKIIHERANDIGGPMDGFFVYDYQSHTAPQAAYYFFKFDGKIGSTPSAPFDLTVRCTGLAGPFYAPGKFRVDMIKKKGLVPGLRLEDKYLHIDSQVPVVNTAEIEFTDNGSWTFHIDPAANTVELL